MKEWVCQKTRGEEGVMIHAEHIPLTPGTALEAFQTQLEESYNKDTLVEFCRSQKKFLSMNAF